MPRKGGDSRAYVAWRNMKARCLRPTHPSYRIYGGRGIKVCERWLKFKNFYDDMGDPPDGTSLERIDNDRNYCLENCRWASWLENMRNRKCTIYLTINGVRLPMAEWCERKGIPYPLAISRYKAGISAKDILSKKKLEKRPSKPNCPGPVTLNGISKPLRDWCEEYGLNYPAVWARIRRGWSIKKALTTPLG